MVRREFAARIAAVVAAFAPGTNRDSSMALQKPFPDLPYHREDTIKGVAFWVSNAEVSEQVWPTAILGEGRFGVVGNALKFSGGMGVGGLAAGEGSAGVDGRSQAGLGVYGAGKTGVQGVSNNREGFGVEGIYRAAPGDYTLFKRAQEGGNITHGMLGTPENGVEGVSNALNGKGVAGRAEKGNSAAAVYGQSAAGFAGFFRGRVTITESLLVKEIYGAKKMFRIDHPLEPATRTLSPASIESDSLKNLYDGVATLDDSGSAWVELPRWFEALNTDACYQLTCIGDYAPVYIAREIERNKFQIAGGTSGMKVSWQVTGIRNDPYAKAHPLHVEEDKPLSERGTYLNPREYGVPEAALNHYWNPDGVAPFDNPPTRTVSR